MDFTGIKKFIREVFSEPNGEASSTRCLMFLFSLFSMWIISRMVKHIFVLTDAGVIAMYLGNLPLIIASLMGLIALPYTINRGAGALTDTFSGIANIVASAKQVHNASFEGKPLDTIKKTQGGLPEAPTTHSGMGTNSPKG
jgi:hypothetical protein